MSELSFPISVAIVEDDSGLRESLHAIVSSVPDLACVGTFGSAEEAWRSLPSTKPAVVLMDVNLPKASGIACVARLASELPQTHFLMLTVYDDSEAIFDSLAAGASGYLRKPMEPEELIDAIRDVHRGGAPMSSTIARRVIQAFRKPAAATAPEDSKVSVFEKLAPREREILGLLSKGHLQKEIAEELGISFSTVRTLTGRIYEKLHVHSRGQAVAKYLGAIDQKA
ncbi:MAG: response regulator transcription factor [Verrucomicrobiota bacterium]